MRPITLDIDLATIDTDGIFEAQQLAGAGDVVLDGAEIVSGEWITPDGFAKKIEIACAGDVQTVVFTITGFRDADKHAPITETITGVNANTVETTEYFYSITSIAADAAVGIDITGGAVDQAITAPLPISWRSGITTINLDVTGTLDFTVQQTYDNIQNLNDLDFAWQDAPVANLVNVTSSTNDAYVGIPRALRVKVNSYSTGAELAVNIVQRDM